MASAFKCLQGPMGPMGQVPSSAFKALWAHGPSALKCLQGPMGPMGPKCPLSAL